MDITINSLAEARQKARMDRGPWPSKEALEHGARELAEELADAYAFAECLFSESSTKETLYDSFFYAHILFSLTDLFFRLNRIKPEAVGEALKIAEGHLPEKGDQNNE